ncbi:hypothetical protein G6F46_011505 [Rhizopus delemar]|uniref:Uncharacterized protein n=2 Tax=Rhizopus TaxID=4842 RepID=A0A9P6YTT1_9FUNG|nr:hypothetical protein G6F55_011002 [Rhizopus delemar]KAG1535322.1 hypothetical protein G6F51_011601 [Rhizopus arrhizus]KAG1487661.1 hypothetical protein G6F54_012519 [Rhizopus delemar]KAG1500266.1 hypothetical protein G6F53_011343 [Rhizopus delemar]KAG1506123.1 hypothetical protein G6F52_011977 [Rhizopus delemar]
MNSNKWQTLEACKVALQQNAHKNHANKFFWENDAKRVVEIASSGLAIDEELLQLEKVTAITALKSFNGTVNANREENERNEEKRKATSQNEQTSSKRQDSNPEKPSFKQLFESFQRQALSQASVNDGLCLETHMYELLSLYDIMLLKPFQFSPSVRHHFGEELLQTLYDEMRIPLYDETKTFGEGIPLIQDIIYNYIQEAKDKTKKKGSKMNCARKLVALTANRPEAEASTLFGIAAL